MIIATSSSITHASNNNHYRSSPSKKLTYQDSIKQLLENKKNKDLINKNIEKDINKLEKIELKFSCYEIEKAIRLKKAERIITTDIFNFIETHNDLNNLNNNIRLAILLNEMKFIAKNTTAILPTIKRLEKEYDAIVAIEPDASYYCNIS